LLPISSLASSDNDGSQKDDIPIAAWKIVTIALSVLMGVIGIVIGIVLIRRSQTTPPQQEDDVIDGTTIFSKEYSREKQKELDCDFTNPLADESEQTIEGERSDTDVSVEREESPDNE
jgi:hypothetical protein